MVVVNWVVAHEALLIGSALVALNEVFAWNPGLKSNSVLQFVWNLLTKAKPSA